MCWKCTPGAPGCAEIEKRLIREGWIWGEMTLEMNFKER